MSPGNDASPSPGPSPLQTGEIPLFLSDALLRHLQSLSSPSGAQLPQLPRSTEGGSIRCSPSPPPRAQPSAPRLRPIPAAHRPLRAAGLSCSTPRGAPAPISRAVRERTSVSTAFRGF